MCTVEKSGRRKKTSAQECGGLMHKNELEQNWFAIYNVKRGRDSLRQFRFCSAALCGRW